MVSEANPEPVSVTDLLPALTDSIGIHRHEGWACGEGQRFGPGDGYAIGLDDGDVTFACGGCGIDVRHNGKLNRGIHGHAGHVDATAGKCDLRAWLKITAGDEDRPHLKPDR